MPATQPRLNRVERAIRAAEASSESLLRLASLQRFKRNLPRIRHMPAGRTSTAKVVGLEN